MADDLHRVALETITIGKQAIIFLPSKSSAEKTAEEIAKKTAFFLPELGQEILTAVSTPTSQCRRLSHCVKKGIAFHHSGLTSKQKDTIEESFKAGKIRIICSTPTLAAGLSLPVFRVIIKSLKRYTGRWGMDWIPVLEYLQMAGRAGRPEYESYGEAITIAKSDA
ncbi:MAG: helicase-related protein [Nanoarchaeota archaeon]|nr:helicase-related protein [Nanoarchaeota archaeon]